MPYMLLIVEPAGQRRGRTADEGRGLYQRMLDYTARLQQQGVLLASSSLRESAARLEVRETGPCYY